MSVHEVTARIQQLHTQFAMLAPPRPPATIGSGSVTQADFTRALGSATRATQADFARTLSDSSPAAPEQIATAAIDNTERRTGPGGVTGSDVVEQARKYLGVPYVWGGTDPGRGLDCSGLVQLVYRKLGIELPRVSYEQATAGTAVSDLAHARPGDILAFGRPVHHVGIYIGDNKMIEAPRPGKDVQVTELYETPSAIRRVLADPATPAAIDRVSGSGVSGAGVSDVPFAELFNRSGRRYGIDPTLLAAVAKQESAFDPGAVSSAGARGLMQLMPGTAEGLGVRDSFDPAQAVDGAARLLRDLLREFDSLDLVLAAYNAGPGAVHRYGGIPPYPETQHYVQAVMGHRTSLAA
ncbi:MAG TPA: transglycosylase SLT domain-containing protein [Nocardioidaceae bacterium]|nr:transglycosylase SLT domain-containing protein [Nocardioidaceae bacterium]